MLKTVSALLFGASLLASAPAGAATVVYNFSGVNGAFYQLFDANLGTLNSAAFAATFTSSASTRRFDFNLQAVNSLAAGGFGLRNAVDGPDITLIPTASFFGQSTFAEGSTMGKCSISGSASNTITTNLNALTGSGQVRAIPTSGVSGCDGSIDYSSISTSFSGTVTYDYTAAVPEPASWAMMLVGFAMLGGAIRHQRSAWAMRRTA